MYHYNRFIPELYQVKLSVGPHKDLTCSHEADKLFTLNLPLVRLSWMASQFVQSCELYISPFLGFGALRPRQCRSWVLLPAFVAAFVSAIFLLWLLVTCSSRFGCSFAFNFPNSCFWYLFFSLWILFSWFAVFVLELGKMTWSLFHIVLETRLKKELAERRKKRTKKKKKKKKVGQKEERILEQSTRGGILCAMS